MGTQKNHYLLLVLALAIGLLFHGSSIFGSLENTYDFYVHVFFASHYSNSWFEPWETRWYTGFSLTSYPPLTHQLIAVFSSIGGLKFGAYVVGFAIIILYITGVYRFSKLITGNRRAAGYAALVGVFTPSVVESLHVFGQMPMMLGIGWLLHALPEIYLWVRYGKFKYFRNAVSIIAVAVCSHHVTPIFGMVFFVLPLMGTAVMDGARQEVENYQKVTLPLFFKYVRRYLPRIIVTGGAIVVAAVVVILPYWIWSKNDPITQVPIPHGSRDNFIEVFSSGLVFFIIPWGFLLALLPYAFYRFFSRRNIFLGLSLVLLFILGTGGTTPVPKILLGENAFSILTLERFTFWATVFVAAIAGEFAWSFFEGPIKKRILLNNAPIVYNFLIGIMVTAIFCSAGFTLNLRHFRSLQPDKIDIVPIINFINSDKHDKWRFLTLGFGDQMAWLSANTHALTIDGNYHSARRVPELTSRAVERLENSKYRGNEGIGTLQQFLTYPEKYHLKYIFSNDKFYDPILYFCGWHRVKLLDNGIMVWEREDVSALPSILPKKEIPHYQKVMWGVMPLMCLILAFFFNLQLHWINHIIRKNKDRDSYSNPEQLRTEVHNVTYLFSKYWFYVVLALTVFIIYRIYFLNLKQITPEKAVLSYYDALDFKEFARAYSYLDAPEDYPVDQFMLELSVTDGLADSYGKLNDIKTRLIQQDSDQALVAVDLTFITPLEVFHRSREHVLKKKGLKWFVKAEPLEYPIPADQFYVTQTADFKNQGKKRITTEETFHTDILDRPVVHILQSSLINKNGQYSVVGLLQNIDSYPADVTLKATLFNDEGAVLTDYTEKFELIHKLSPKETTPFRIDFEALGWTDENRDKDLFDPREFREADLVEMVCSFKLEALATVTTHDLFKDMAIMNVKIDKQLIRGKLFNQGTKAVTIPQLLFAYYDPEGNVLWVDHLFVDRSILPRRIRDFRKYRPDLSQVTLVAESAQETLVNGLDNGSITAKYKSGHYTINNKVDVQWPEVASLTFSLNNYVGNPTPF